MKKSINRITAACAALLVLWACSGTTEELPLTMTADVQVIPADGLSKAKFTVYEGNADVTAEAVIIEAATGNELKDATFTTTVPGEYFFHAEYRTGKSEQIKIIAEEVIVSQFVRNVCLMEFTDGSCNFCPDASRYIDKNILQKNPDVHLIAFHEKDQWKSPQFAQIASKFNITSTPYAVVDMRESVSLESGARSLLKEAIAASQNQYTPHCAVSVSSAIDAQQKAKVDVKLYSEKSTDYYLAVYVVEDGLKGYQLDGGIGYDDYYHQFVARQMLSQTIYGDNLGRVQASEEKSASYEVAADPQWNLQKTYVYVLAMTADGKVNNMQVCLLNGGSAGYEYKK